MPHDTTGKPDTGLRRRRQNGAKTGKVMLGKSTGRRRLSSKSRSLSASDAAAVTNNPHSIENLPALSSLSDLSPLQLTLTAATNLRQNRPSYRRKRSLRAACRRSVLPQLRAILRFHFSYALCEARPALNFRLPYTSFHPIGGFRILTYEDRQQPLLLRRRDRRRTLNL